MQGRAQRTEGGVLSSTTASTCIRRRARVEHLKLIAACRLLYRPERRRVCSPAKALELSPCADWGWGVSQVKRCTLKSAGSRTTGGDGGSGFSGSLCIVQGYTTNSGGGGGGAHLQYISHVSLQHACGRSGGGTGLFLYKEETEHVVMACRYDWGSR